MRLYFQYAAMHVRSSMQYKTSFALSMFGQLCSTVFGFLSVFLLFDRFGTLLDYSFGEVALCFAVVNLSFAVAECGARGFDTFFRLIVRGDFDRLLLRPRSLVLQVLGSQFELTKIGRMLYSACILIWAVSALDTVWTLARAATVALMVLGGTAIFTGIFILGSTLCFFTVQGLEVINIFTDGGRELAGFPMTIYAKWVTRFFTFIIPFAAINYLPLHFVAGRAENPLYMLLPLIGVVYIAPCLAVWYRGARRYTSTGS